MANDLYPLRIAGGAWSIAVAVTVRVIAAIAAETRAIPIVVADISHRFAWREVLGRGGETAHGERRCRHSHSAAQRGAGDKTDRESFHGTPPGISCTFNGRIAAVPVLHCRLRRDVAR